jgi:hypothetical protein
VARQGRQNPALEQVLGRGEPLHALPQTRRWELSPVALDDGELLGNHRHRPLIELQALHTGKALVREGQLADLSWVHQGEKAAAPTMHDLLVERRQQGGADPAVSPLGVERKGEKMCVRPANLCDGRAHQAAP